MTEPSRIRRIVSKSVRRPQLGAEIERKRVIDSVLVALPRHANLWILSSGSWDDSRLWDDNQLWRDGA